MRKLFKGLLAALSLTALAVPAAAHPRVELRIDNYHHRGWESNQPFFYNRHYRYFPACNSWEVPVRSPYRYGEWMCIPRTYYEGRR